MNRTALTYCSICLSSIQDKSGSLVRQLVGVTITITIYVSVIEIVVSTY